MRGDAPRLAEVLELLQAAAGLQGKAWLQSWAAGDGCSKVLGLLLAGLQPWLLLGLRLLLRAAAAAGCSCCSCCCYLKFLQLKRRG